MTSRTSFRRGPYPCELIQDEKLVVKELEEDKYWATVSFVFSLVSLGVASSMEQYPLSILYGALSVGSLYGMNCIDRRIQDSFKKIKYIQNNPVTSCIEWTQKHGYR